MIDFEEDILENSGTGEFAPTRNLSLKQLNCQVIHFLAS